MNTLWIEFHNTNKTIKTKTNENQFTHKSIFAVQVYPL